MAAAASVHSTPTRSALVTGATGLLGRAVLYSLKQAGWSVTGTGHTRASPPETIALDLTDTSALQTLFQRLQPLRLLVHCAAERAPDKVDNDPEAAERLNVGVTKSLAALSKEHGVVMIYISSDYVFPGRKGEAPYGVGSKTEPPNLYGRMKLAGEEAIRGELGEKFGTDARVKGVSLRIPVLYGDGGVEESSINILEKVVRDSVSSMEANEYKGKRKGVDDWAIRYPTCTEDVARVIRDIGELYTSSDAGKQLPDTLQFSSQDRCTKFGICELLAGTLDLSLDGLQAESEEPVGGDGVASRPYDCHLDTASLQELGISVRTVDFAAWWKKRLSAFKH